MIHDLENSKYNECLTALNLGTVDLVETCQLFHNHLNIDTSDLITTATFQLLEVIITNYSNLKQTAEYIRSIFFTV